jgi:hypothetical protein
MKIEFTNRQRAVAVRLENFRRLIDETTERARRENRHLTRQERADVARWERDIEALYEVARTQGSL